MKVTIDANKKDISLNAKGEKIKGIGKPNVQMLPPGVEFDYNELKGKPSINGVPLIGNKTTEELNIIAINEDEFGNKVALKIDPKTYVVTLELINKKDVVLSTAKIDLPLETMVVNARYDNQAKELIIVLNNGTELKVPIGDIIRGLVSETTFNNTVTEINKRIKTAEDNIVKINKDIVESNKNIGINTKRIKTVEKNIFDSGKVKGLNSFNVKNSALAEMQEVKMSINKAQETTEGYNLFDKSKATLNRKLNGGYDTDSEKIGWFISDYIPITKTYYYILGIKIAEHTISFYDKDKVFITSLVNLGSTNIHDGLIPSNAKYIRFDNEMADIDETMFTAIKDFYDIPTYEPYTGGVASPNPNYPQEINKVVDNFEFTSNNGNLFDDKKWYNDLHEINPQKMTKETINGVEYFKIDTKIGADNLAKYRFMEGQFKENTQYSISFTGYKVDNGIVSRTAGFAFALSNGDYNFANMDNQANAKEREYTYTNPVGTTIKYIYLGMGTAIYVKNIVLVEGTSVSAEMYNQSITNLIDLKGNEFLPGDEFTFKFNEQDGKYWSYLKKNTKKITLTGKDFVGRIEVAQGILYRTNMVYSDTDYIEHEVYCNRYFGVINELARKEFTIYYNKNTRLIDLIDSRFNTIEEFKKFLDLNPLEVIIFVTNPELIPLAPIDIMNMTYNPETNAFTSIDNINIEAKYYRDFINSMNNLETDVANNKTDISNIKAEQTTQNNNISKNSEDIENIKTEQATQDDSINAIKTEQATQNNDINAIKTEQATQNNNISKNSEDIGNIKAEQETQNNEITNIKGDILESNKNIARNTKRIKTLETNIFDSGLAEGTSINIQDSALAEMQEVKMSIDKAQESTEGYNLFNALLIRERSSQQGLNVEHIKGKVIINGTPTSDYIGILFREPINTILKENGEYSFKPADNKLMFKIIERNKQTSDEKNYFNPIININTDINDYFMTVQTGTLSNTGTFNNYEVKMTINLGQPKPYEPYTGGIASPNPEYPQEINKVVDNFEFTSSGKNIFSIDNFIKTFPESKPIKNDNYLGVKCFSYLNNDNSLFKFMENNFKENTQYSFYLRATFNWNDVEAYSMPYLAISYTDGTTEYIQKYSYSTNFNDIYVTSSKGKTIKYLSIPNFGGARLYVERIQLEYGDKSTSYSSYQAITNTIDLKGNEFLPGDEFTFKFNEQDGKYWSYLKKNIRNLELKIADMNNYDTIPGWTNTPFINNDFKDFDGRLARKTSYKSNIFRDNIGFSINTLGGNQILFIDKFVSTEMTQTELKKKYPNLVVQLCYKRPTPELIPLAPIDIMNMTYNPITNVNTSIDNIKMTIKYYRDFIHTIRNLQVDSKKALALETQLQELETRLQALETKQASLDIEGGNENA